MQEGEHNFAKMYLYGMHQVYVLVQKHMEKKLAEANKLSFSQFWVLVCFTDCPGKERPTAALMAKKMYISEATLSGHVNRLLKQGYIEKTEDLSNRRKSIINMTKKGSKVFNESKKIVETELEKIFNVVPIKDRKVVLQSFEDIIGKIKDINN